MNLLKTQLVERQKPKTINQNPPFGHVGSARAGDIFESRIELSLRGQHRPRRAGVCGMAQGGTESLVLAEQYEDDEIHDDYFWYAGHGGRDQKTGRQVSDQDFNARNQALARSRESGLPVRVYRRLPDGRYRYEGLWRVTDHTLGPGRSGFRVYRFRLEPWRAVPS